ncbi:putative collagen-binding protein [Rivularia sp. PCC 7116]|uniref:SdrD B-like domain-containing protein n=1 Tax=Rivularia sp. PCC 7116 TaxID=373994 RepID=UPI00029F2C0C|nr:SdrD B-like domain-containing protein [Rivularia sp. PCC 7116]AFY57075.1 putative collagen-binding protein [Rivularia sp. PCC 7116]
MKALFKHLSSITQGEPGSVANNTRLSSRNISSPFLSTTLLAVLLGVPQIPIMSSGKAIAQNAASCPAGTTPETIQFNASDSLQDLTQIYSIGGIRTVLSFIEEVPNRVIDRTESRIDGGVYGGLQGPNLRLNIGPGKPPETGNLAPGSATLTITFAQPVTLASPLTLLDVDQEGERDSGRFFRDIATVTAANNNSNVAVNLQALGSFTQVSGNTASGTTENSLPDQGQGNVSVTPQGAVDQINITYTPDTSQQRGQDQTIGLAPFTICAPGDAGTIGDTVYQDLNGDGTQNPGEAGIPGINLTLINPGPDGQFGTPDDTTETTTTDNNGRYNFPVPAGNYRVTVDNPPQGFSPTQTPPQTIVVAAGQNFDTADFGFLPQQIGSIGDTVYRDNNNNNVQDEGDTGIPGVQVTLTSPGADGQLGTPDDTNQTTTTNEQGIYTFPNLPAGNYQVTSATPDALNPTQTQPNPVELQPGQNIDTVDFGFAPTPGGTVGDTVYRDENGDGTQNEGEPGLPGVEVTLVNPGPDGQFGTPDDTTQTTTTDENGTYGFPNVPPGDYQVVVNNPPDGLTPTQTPPQTVTVQPGQNFEDADFGFSPQQTGSIGDTVYRDNNNNNVQDEGDTGIPGVQVTLTSPGADGQLGTPDDTNQTTTTNEQGIYTFPNLPAGNYQVTSATPDGLNPTQTQPNPVELQPGQNIDTVDFGFSPPQGGTVGDTVYRDENGDGTQNEGEPGIPGVEVTLVNPGPDGQFGTPDDTTQTTTTDENGTYGFPNVPPGDYQVVVNNPPDGLTPTQTPPQTVTVQPGEDFEDADFGFAPQQIGSIGDTVYRDNNNNNVQDEGDTGIGGVQVTLTSPGADGQLGTPDDTTQTTTTNDQGIYTFPNLPAGNYQVTSATPDGLNPTQTQPNPVELQPGQNIDTVDFGFAPTPGGTVGDTVYRDENGDGTQNEGEPGLPGVEVTLVNPGPDGQFGTPDDTTQTTTTDENGTYGFPNVPPGDYQVVVNNPPDGLTPTQTPPQTVTVQPGEDFEDADFGFSPQQIGSIGDTVYTDGNSNNQQDEGEEGIPGATVTLTLPGPDEQLGTGDDTTQTTTTNEQGIYTFPNLPAGNYRVTATSPREGDNPTQTQPDAVELQPGQNLDTVDFGFVPGPLGQGQGTIGDTVYNDTNRNNQQDEGETGIPGATVTLTNPGEDGEFGTPDDTTQTTTTNENGNYSFPNLPAGNYRVTTTTPDGLTPTQTPDETVALAQNQNLDTVDFGFAPQEDGTGSIGDTVYNDTNSNNQQDEGETGIPGVTVTLTTPGEDGQFGNEDDTTQTTTTNEQGIYGFTNLPPANYRVTTETPNGLNPTQTQPDVINLQGGQNIDTIDFGFAGQDQGTGSIGDTVYNDTNRNSQQDEGETGIPGVTVTLTSPGEDGQLGTPDDTTTTTTTNEQGNYNFPNLPAGNYRVTITNPDGLTPTQTPPETIELEENENDDTVDFGLAPAQGTGSIGDTVYNDTNRNSQQDEGETGIPGVTVTLTSPGEDGQLGTPDDTTTTTTTNEQGNYNFPNLPAGNYRVTITNPDGLTPTQTPPETIELEENENDDTVDFGLAPAQGTGSIGDTVYNDTNRNNQQDEGETGVPGVIVTLTTPGEDGQLGNEDDTTQTTTTDEQGNYNFPNVPAGNYRVTITNPDGLSPTQTPPETVTVGDNQNIDTADFGLAPGQQQGTGSLGDTVYNDLNNNGQQDEGEPGIAGVVVNYAGTGPDGVFGESLTDDDTSGRTSTDANGRYTFPNLPAGTYRVTINDQSQQPIREFSQTQTPNNPITLNEGDNIDTADFGFTQPTGTIGDTVYQDNNSDGTQNEGEPGIPGVEVTLTRPGEDGQLGTPDDTTDTTTTNDQGNYSFPNVPTGNYRVTVNNSPDGLNPTQTPPSNIPLQPGQNFNDADFGFSPQQVGTIGDLVFFDNDGDSTPDNDESGIPGLTLVLRDANGNVVATTNTDEDGAYSFVAPPGTYTVTVSNPPQGLNPTLTQDNPVNLQAGQNIDTVDFGFQPPSTGSIGDTVFADENGNGVQEPGEPGVSGVVVRLVRPGQDGVFGTGDDQVEEQRTDNTDTVAFNENTPGQYTFDNLPPGDYQVQMVLPDGSILTTGANPISVDLQPGQNLDSADFGIRMTGFGGENPGSIGDEVFNDTDGDGVRDEGEPGVPNVTVTLTQPGPDNQLGTADDTTQETTTNDQGNYTFGDLPPGPYRITVTPPLNLSEVTNPGGSQIERNLQPGQDLTNADFGLRGPSGGSIGDTVFNDTDGDGVQDFTDSNNNGVKEPNEEGEAGIPGVQLTLRNANGDIFATTTTNENGNYIFNGLPLANYTVEAARPNDFSPTTETTLSAQLTEATPNRNEIDFGFRPGLLGASGPTNLRLVKRITNVLRGNQPISGVNFNQFEDDANDENDNVLNSSPQSSPVGITRLETPVQSGDEIEYTIYFLSEGGEALQNVRVCDVVPNGTAFVNGSITVNGGGNGADNGNFLTPLSPVPAEFQNICLNGTPANGAVLTNLGTLPAGGQFGFVRFRVRVN